MMAPVLGFDTKQNATSAKSGFAKRFYFGCEVIQFKNKRPSCDVLLFYPIRNCASNGACPYCMKKFHSFFRRFGSNRMGELAKRELPAFRLPAAPAWRGRRG